MIQATDLAEVILASGKTLSEENPRKVLAVLEELRAGELQPAKERLAA